MGSEPRREAVEHAGEGRRVDLRPVEPLLRALEARYRPEQIWLFGSRARGDARSGSDWDILVVVSDSTADADLSPLVPWGLKREADVRADIVIYRRSEFLADRTVVNTLPFEVSRDGLLIHER